MEKMYQNLNENIITQVSQSKNEPKWMLDLRLKAFEIFLSKPFPSFGPDLSSLDLDAIMYHSDKPRNIAVDEAMRSINIKEESLGGIGTQFDTQTIYHKLKSKWESLGIIFLDLDTALQTHENLVKQYFTKCISISDHKFISLHYAMWSGGTFLYIPSNVHMDEPLHSYFAIQNQNSGQFEHTIIIADTGSIGHYIEGCGSANTGNISLHSGCVEIFLNENSKFNYSSIENWAKNTFNLNTKRAILKESAHIDWVSSNTGSKVTMLYPMTILQGDNSTAEYTNIAIASNDQYQDTGVKISHLGKNTKSNTISKSISKESGYTNFRSYIYSGKLAENAEIFIKCDGILLDDDSLSDTTPVFDIHNETTLLNHEARSGKLDEDTLFYLESRGIVENIAINMILNSFISPFIKKLPLEYAVEINRMIEEELMN